MCIGSSFLFHFLRIFLMGIQDYRNINFGNVRSKDIKILYYKRIENNPIPNLFPFDRSYKKVKIESLYLYN